MHAQRRAELLDQLQVRADLLGAADLDHLPRVDAERPEVRLEPPAACRAGSSTRRTPRPMQVERLGVGHPAEQARQVEHAERDVAGLVALVQRDEVAQHGLDPRLAHHLEQRQRHRLDHHLHSDELLRQGGRAQRAHQHPRGARAEPLRHLADHREVVVHDVEVAGLVVGLRGGGELRLERLEPHRQLRRHLPRRELPPQDDGEQALQGLPLLGVEPDAAVAGDELGQHGLAVPREALALVVEPLELRGRGRLDGVARRQLVEHVERQRDVGPDPAGLVAGAAGAGQRAQQLAGGLADRAHGRASRPGSRATRTNRSRRSA
ncbi:MAG: hypothetical protein R3F59_09775 [Myxococcota bacterium]